MPQNTTSGFAKVYKCATCGEALDLKTAENGIIRCKVCDSVNTIPKSETNPEALDYLRSANLLLETCKFDDAYTAFSHSAECDSNEPEAYFGMALASFQVQYLKDITGEKPRLQPICHRISQKAFAKDGNYLHALEVASEEQRELYKKKAAEIDYIGEEFYKLEQSGLDYDCFICTKVTDENGDNTDDSKDADYIYTLLQNKGYTPFYSERNIRNKTGADYEAMILYALYTSETMLVVCRKEEYLRTPWVKNEYTRFLKLVNDEQKESDSIACVYYEKPIERLPGRSGKLQGIDFSKRDSDGKIVDFVELHTPKSRAKRENEAQSKQREGQEIKRQIEEQKRLQAELEKRLNAINSGEHSTIGNILTRAAQEAEARNFDEAKKYYLSAREKDPKNAEAWWGLFLTDFEVCDEQILLTKISNLNSDEALKSANEISENVNYKNAIRYAGSDSKYIKFAEDVKGRVRSVCEAEMVSCDNKIKSCNSRKETCLSIIKDTEKKLEYSKQRRDNKQRSYNDDKSLSAAKFFSSDAFCGLVAILGGLAGLVGSITGFSLGDPFSSWFILWKVLIYILLVLVCTAGGFIVFAVIVAIPNAICSKKVSTAEQSLKSALDSLDRDIANYNATLEEENQKIKNIDNTINGCEKKLDKINATLTSLTSSN